MGPSGSGKTTLLNVLARRAAAAGADVDGDVLINGNTVSTQEFRRISSYVEQEDALIGSLTVQETISFAAQLSLSRYVILSMFMSVLGTNLVFTGLFQKIRNNREFPTLSTLLDSAIRQIQSSARLSGRVFLVDKRDV